MQRKVLPVVVLFSLIMTALWAVAQQTTPPANPPTSQTPATQAVPPSQIIVPGQASAPKAPDMVCFGYGPKWSIQFVNGAARYLGVNQPDQTLLGDFYWVAQDKAWEWHRANDLAPMNGSFGLSATVQKQACTDPVRKQTYPYSAQVNLPQGDMVSGCCRKLRPGEAAVGPHGLQQTVPGSNAPGAGAQGGSQPSGSQQDNSQQQGNQQNKKRTPM
jgi:uncharacterized membrane protein